MHRITVHNGRILETMISYLQNNAELALIKLCLKNDFYDAIKGKEENCVDI